MSIKDLIVNISAVIGDEEKREQLRDYITELIQLIHIELSAESQLALAEALETAVVLSDKLTRIRAEIAELHRSQHIGPKHDNAPEMAYRAYREFDSSCAEVVLSLSKCYEIFCNTFGIELPERLLRLNHALGYYRPDTEPTLPTGEKLTLANMIDYFEPSSVIKIELPPGTKNANIIPDLIWITSTIGQILQQDLVLISLPYPDDPNQQALLSQHPGQEIVVPGTTYEICPTVDEKLSLTFPTGTLSMYSDEIKYVVSSPAFRQDIISILAVHEFSGGTLEENSINVTYISKLDPQKRSLKDWTADLHQAFRSILIALINNLMDQHPGDTQLILLRKQLLNVKAQSDTWPKFSSFASQVINRKVLLLALSESGPNSYINFATSARAGKLLEGLKLIC